jgi:hypothetical protein
MRTYSQFFREIAMLKLEFRHFTIFFFKLKDFFPQIYLVILLKDTESEQKTWKLTVWHKDMGTGPH